MPSPEMISTSEEVETKVKAIIAEYLDIDLAEIKPESRIIIDLGADSLDLIDLIQATEDELEVDLPEDLAISSKEDEAVEPEFTVTDLVKAVVVALLS